MGNYYQAHFDEYYQRTYAVNPSSFLDPFVEMLPREAAILDVGCGSGRDLRWLNNQGFQVTGFEESSGLAELARKHAGCTVIEGDFETHDFNLFTVDAILASGSLVHVSHDRLPQVLRNIKHALAHGGLFYVSLKKGEKFRTDQTGRTFYLWQDAELRGIFSELDLDVIHFSNTESVLNSKDWWLGYVLKEMV